MSNPFPNIKKKLPHRFGKILSERLEGLTKTQVILVFNGKITDPQIITKVINESELLIKELEALNRLDKRMKKRPKKRKAKPKV